MAADAAAEDISCQDEPEPEPEPDPEPTQEEPAPSGGGGDNCAAGYSPCVPVYPPDVKSADVSEPVIVTGNDPHGLDRDGDGVACESG
ncbi:excalibur calcium-binding domain-containing protein [Nesterenkonia sp. F]|uniref:excalibur calcium-binding domain-containing protein n=1 Tax=Nesterenkonia sp. F TaxID=795955 RepID=UPI0005247DB9|nr:excalibur calcium-binding domain-containing protein [Nesterenkonia sp. F]